MSKRCKGEGSIYRRKDGRWTAVANVGWKNGKRVRKNFYGKTQGEVRAKLTRARRDQDLGLPPADERQRMATFLVNWLEATARPRLRARVFADYRMIVERHLVPALGQLRMAELSPNHVQELLSNKTAEGLSASRVRGIRAVFRTAMDQAFRWGMLPRNVVDMVRGPRLLRHEATIFTVEQAQTFLSVVSEHRLGALFSVALAVGLRLGEALGLQWKDVDLEGGTLRVRQSLQRVDGELVLGETKSDKSRRNVVLPAVVNRVLRSHQVRQKEERLLAGGRWQTSDFVFTSTTGTPLDDRNVRRAYHALLKQEGLPRIRIHDLRHTCASLLLAQGVHPKVVQEILGHSQVSLTLDTYSHVLPHVGRAAAAEMDALLGAG